MNESTETTKTTVQYTLTEKEQQVVAAFHQQVAAAQRDLDAAKLRAEGAISFLAGMYSLEGRVHCDGRVIRVKE